MCTCCGHKAPYNDLKEKHHLICPKFPVSCQYCDVNYERQHLDEHIARFCDLIRVSCRFHVVGCTEEFLRKDMGSHLKAANETHIALLNKYLEDRPNPSQQCQSLTVICLEQSYSYMQQLHHRVEQLQNDERQSHHDVEQLRTVVEQAQTLTKKQIGELRSEFIKYGIISMAVVVALLGIITCYMLV